MNNANEKPRPRRQPGTGQAETAALAGATISMSDSTANDAPRQPHGKIFDLLPAGESHAVPARDLANLTGISPRRLRRMVDNERERGVPILASDCGYFRPADGPAGVAEVRRFLRRQDSRMASNRRVVAPLQRLLKTLERGPIPGQISIEEEVDGDE